MGCGIRSTAWLAAQYAQFGKLRWPSLRHKDYTDLFLEMVVDSAHNDKGCEPEPGRFCGLWICMDHCFR